LAFQNGHKAVDHVDFSLVTTLMLFSVARMNALDIMDFNWPGHGRAGRFDAAD